MEDKTLTFLYAGNLFKGELLTLKDEYVEATCTENDRFIVGEHIQMFFKGKTYDMRILQFKKSWLALFPSTSEIFNLTSRRPLNDTDRRKTLRFSFDTVALLKDQRQTAYVNTVDISRGGLGLHMPKSIIQSQKMPVQSNALYVVSLGCSEEWITFSIIIRNLIEAADGYRIGAEIHEISDAALNQLRYFIVSTQLYS